MAINTDLVSFYDLATGADSIGGYTLTAANGAAFSGTATLPNFNSSIYAATQIPLGGGDFSLSFWFKDLKSRASAAANFMVFGAYSNGGAAGAFGGSVAKYPIVIYTNDELGVWDGSFQSTGVQVTQASTGASWHLMNAVYDSTAATMTFYMDGSQVGSSISFNGMPSIQVFGSFTNFNYNASENMDDIAVWQRKITPTEIGQIYSAGQGNFSTLIPINTNLVFNAPLGTDGNDIINGLAGATSSVSFVTDTGFTAADFASGSAAVNYGIDSAQGPAVLGTSPFTLTAWVKPATPVNPGAVIIGTTISGSSSPQYSGYQLRLNGTNLELMIGGGGANEIPVSSSITFSAWHHVAVTRSGTAIVLYIDGAVVDTGTAGSVYDTASSYSGHFLTSGMTTNGSLYFYGYNGLISDTAMWKRALSGAEITSIYNAGTAKLLSLLPGPAILEGQFGSVVHSSAPSLLKMEGQWGSVVHDASPSLLKLEAQWGSVVHSSITAAAIVPDIAGTVGVPATFDGSASTSVSYYHWSWVSVPGGSSIANAPIPFLDNAASGGIIDMTGSVGLWHMDGNANDTSGSSNNAAVTGTSYVAGKVGTNALSFASGDFASVPDAASLHFSTGTISFWLKTSQVASRPSLISKNDTVQSRNGWHVYLINGKINVQLKAISFTTITTPSAINDNAWHHVAVVFASGGTSKVFIDGALAGSDASTVTFTTTTSQPMRMGINVDTYWQDYEGALDEVALFSRALTDDEVSNIYLAQNGTLAGLGSDTFTFTPDIVGTYQINLAIDGSTNTNADCVVTLPAAGGGDPSQGASLQGGGLQGSGVDLQGYT
jgi:hypothetical protein